MSETKYLKVVFTDNQVAEYESNQCTWEYNFASRVLMLTEKEGTTIIPFDNIFLARVSPHSDK